MKLTEEERERLLDEITALRAYAAGMRRAIIDADPYITGVHARERLREAIENRRGLTYEIH